MPRYALVVGVANYQQVPLNNPNTDAAFVIESLEKRGFQITAISDVDAETFIKVLASFKEQIPDAEIALIYLAGHAVERHGKGYFLPVDFPFPLSPYKVKNYGISLNEVVDATQPARTRIIVLDACRNWPTDPTDRLRLNEDLDQLAMDERTWQNVLLAYSTSSSDTAGDGLLGARSTFCEEFCQAILDHNLSINECFQIITQEVIKKSRLRQQPWTYSSLQRSASFSDLHRFAPLLRHMIPHDARSAGFWFAPHSNNQGIFAGGIEKEQVWFIDETGPKKVNFSGSSRLVGATHLAEQLILAANDGEVFLVGRPEAAIKLPVKPSSGISASPDFLTVTHFGDRTATIFTVEETHLVKTSSINTNFDIYCCTYISNEKIWLGGENGKITEIEVKQGKIYQREIAELESHIYSMITSPEAASVFCAGGSGLLAEVNDKGEARRLLKGCRPKTPAGVRSRLVGVAGDRDIHQFIFHPTKLQPDVLEYMEDQLGLLSFNSCSHAPNLPILAAGTDESTIMLIDTRDSQILQEIDISAGHPSYVYGLCFLSDSELVALGSDGQIIFLST